MRSACVVFLVAVAAALLEVRVHVSLYGGTSRGACQRKVYYLLQPYAPLWLFLESHAMFLHLLRVIHAAAES